MQVDLHIGKKCFREGLYLGASYGSIFRMRYQFYKAIGGVEGESAEAPLMMERRDAAVNRTGTGRPATVMETCNDKSLVSLSHVESQSRTR